MWHDIIIFKNQNSDKSLKNCYMWFKYTLQNYPLIMFKIKFSDKELIHLMIIKVVAFNAAVTE